MGCNNKLHPSAYYHPRLNCTPAAIPIAPRWYWLLQGLAEFGEFFILSRGAIQKNKKKGGKIPPARYYPPWRTCEKIHNDYTTPGCN